MAALLAAVGLAGFIWAVRRGQFDDLDTPAVRVLHDDDDYALRKGRTAAAAFRSTPPPADL